MSLESEDQLPLERKSESQKQSKILYTREHLLSFSSLEICKKLPSGFDDSILSELDEASIIVNERQRGVGGLTFPSTKFGDYGSSPPNRSDATGGYSRGSSGRWDARSSGSSNRDGDLQSNREAFMQDSGRHFGTQSQRSWQHPEQDGLLGSGAFSRPSGNAGPSAPKARPISHFQLNRTSEPYQPPRPYKALPFQRKGDKDSCNDETFGSTNYSSEDRAEEERRRRASFELMRKEQQKTLQEKQKQIPGYHKENLDVDILALLENSADKKSIMNKNEKADDSSSLSQNDSSRLSFTTQAPLSRPLVPPGFSNTALDKNLRVQSSSAYFASEVSFAGTVNKLPLDGTDNNQEKRNQSAACLDDSIIKSGPMPDLSANDDEKFSIPSSGLELVKLPVNAENVSCTTSGLQKVNVVWEKTTENDVSDKKEEKSEIITSLMQDSSTSILEKLLGSSLSKSSGSPPISSVNQGFKTDEETWVPAISESSKFASWFLEEENKHVEDFSSKDLLSLIVNNEEVGSPASVVSCDKAIEHMEPRLPFKISDTTEKFDESPGTSLIVGIPEQYHQGDKPDSSPVVLTCEDLEQSILADIKGSSSNLQHAVQGPWTTDGKLEQQKSDVDDDASQHILSLLQKGTKKEKMVSVTSTGLDIGFFDKFSITDTNSSFNHGIAEKSTSCNSETVSSLEKTLTLEALFGAAFMNELQSAQAPVSVQRVSDGGINTTAIPTSLGFPFPNSDASFFSSSSGDYQPNRPVHERDMVSLNHIQDANAHYILGPSKEHGNSLVENSKLGAAAGFVGRALEIHLPDEDSLINGRTSQLPHIINQARPLHPGLDHFTDRNQQMKLIDPEGIHHDPNRNFPENIVPHNTSNPASGPHVDPSAYHLMLQQMPIPGNFPQQLPLPGLPRGATLSHPINHMQGYIPEMNNVHNMSSHHQQPNYGSLGMGMPGSLIGGGGGNHPDAFQRLMEMELRANEKRVHPAAAGHIPGTYGPEFDLSFRYR